MIRRLFWTQLTGLAVVVSTLGASFPAHAAVLPAGFAETLVAGGISSPTAMDVAPDGRIFVAEQGGRLVVIKNGVLLTRSFLNLTSVVDSAGERGLLGVAFDPDFATNNRMYVYYTLKASPSRNRVSRFTASGDEAVAGSETVLLELDSLSSAINHNGGAIHFGPDGKLYVATGDDYGGANARSLSTLLGKIPWKRGCIPPAPRAGRASSSRSTRARSRRTACSPPPGPTRARRPRCPCRAATSGCTAEIHCPPIPGRIWPPPTMARRSPSTSTAAGRGPWPSRAPSSPPAIRSGWAATPCMASSSRLRWPS